MSATLFVDYRTGSKELLPLVQRWGLSAELTTLAAADFAFEGNGPNGSLQIGVERKAIGDLIQSLLDGRLAGMDKADDDTSGGGQLGKLQRSYDIVYLLVEGRFKVDANGRLCWGKRRGFQPLPGGMTEDAMAKRLLSLQHQGGLYIAYTEDKAHSARWLTSLVRWWSDKQWHEHQTLNVRHKPRSIVPLSRFREMALPLPNVGLAASKALEKLVGDMPLRKQVQRLLDLSFADLTDMKVQTPKGPKRFGDSRASDLINAFDKQS